MNKIFKTLTMLIASILFTTTINAATANISVSTNKNQVVVGNTFTVTTKVSGSNLGVWEWTLNYDTKKFKLVSGGNVRHVSDFSDNIRSKTWTLKAIAKGSGNISVKAYGVYTKNEVAMKVTTNTKTVRVITQAELEASYSKDNNLKSLSIDGLKLEPAFNKDTTEYKVTAESNTTEIKINATKSDSKADLSGTGTFKVTEGENKFTITVEAENGSVKKYNILVNVTDPNPITVKINDIDYTVVKRESNLTKPEDYEKKDITINDQKVPAFYNEVNNFILVGLKNTEGDIKLFLYDSKTNTFSEYKEIKLDQLKLYPLTIDKEINNYKLSKITINDIEFDALIQDNSDYAIIHAQNMNNGTSDYYTYDKKTNTVITYTNEALKPLEEKINKYEKMILLLTGETILVFFILLCILISKIRHTKKRKKLHQMIMQQKELEERQKEIKEKEEKEEKESNEKNEVKEETKPKKKKKDKKKKN
ncbi:MAG: cadherin-like beta sandwich domain-containing protein [Bacilli bacterium]